jgi:ABC-type bacteriocin/lantibiotic exporter with double-glycine peptidase domain
MENCDTDSIGHIEEFKLVYILFLIIDFLNFCLINRLIFYNNTELLSNMTLKSILICLINFVEGFAVHKLQKRQKIKG